MAVGAARSGLTDAHSDVEEAAVPEGRLHRTDRAPGDARRDRASRQLSSNTLACEMNPLRMGEIGETISIASTGEMDRGKAERGCVPCRMCPQEGQAKNSAAGVRALGTAAMPGVRRSPNVR